MCCFHLNRREFLGATAGLMAGAAVAGQALGQGPAWAPDRWDPDRPFRTAGRPLRVQPVLMYRLPQRREMASWKSWGGVQTERAVLEEAGRIAGELRAVAAQAPFPLEMLPVAHVTSPEEGLRTRDIDCDATIVYPATGTGDMLLSCVPDRGAIVFARHTSGPVYYWYEALSVKYLRTERDPGGPDDPRRLSTDDVVVDAPSELLWRLRGLYGAHNLRGARVVALGGPAGKYAPDAPDVARQRYGLDIVDVSYDDFGPRIGAALADAQRMAAAEAWTRRYLALPHTKVCTRRDYITKAFVLYGLFKDLLEEHGASVFTIRGCMGTVLPLSETTACLTLALLNDEGLLAFCESDFVVIPAGILMHHVCGRPVFMHNSTFPHNGVVTCAHCTGPRRMDGNRYEPVELHTHYESEFGAAPKVDMPIGQEVTFISPEYSTDRWVGMRGRVEANPFYEICRSQQDVRIHGDWRRLLSEVRDSHWIMAYGDWTRELAYAAPRIGIRWDAIPDRA